nr:reverse transcriptase domain-containing protein [Tanacetum cinerariifolium]
MLRAPIEGCAEAIVVPPILAEQFELNHRLINMMTSEQFFGLEKDNPHDHGQPAGGLKKNPCVQSPLGEDECVEETYTDSDLAEYTIKVPPPPVQKPNPPVQRHFVLHTRDSSLPHIPYPSRMLKQKQQEKDDIQIQKFWNMFKQLHLNITLAEALVLMPKNQKMLKALLSNKEKLQELANTPLNENCSAVILKKLPKNLETLGSFSFRVDSVSSSAKP